MPGRVAVASPYWRTFTGICWQEAKTSVLMFFFFLMQQTSTGDGSQILVGRREDFFTCVSQSKSYTNTHDPNKCNVRLSSQGDITLNWQRMLQESWAQRQALDARNRDENWVVRRCVLLHVMVIFY